MPGLRASTEASLSPMSHNPCGRDFRRLYSEFSRVPLPFLSVATAATRAEPTPPLAGCPTPSRPLAAGAGHPPLKTHACGRSDLPPAQRSSPPATPSASAVRPDVQTCSCLRALAPAVPAAWEAFPTETCMAGFFSCLDVFPHTAGSLVRRTRGQPGATLPGLETLFCHLPATGHRECRFASPRLAFLVRKTWRMTIICGVTTRLK